MDFDPTPYWDPNVDKYLVFWMVVWAEDGNKLVSEIPGHGLNGIPESLTSLADVSAQEYSNNVGFYKFAFHVARPKAAVGEVGDPLEDVGGTPALLDIGKVEISNPRPGPSQEIEVSAMVSAFDKSASGVTVRFYDGDPRLGGRALDAERLSYIGAAQSMQAKINYHTAACGVHNIFVTVHEGLPSEVTRVSAPVVVNCTNR